MKIEPSKETEVDNVKKQRIKQKSLKAIVAKKLESASVKKVNPTNVAKKDSGVKKKPPASKSSSLFGNNPQVPNIGQRLVKPVQEEIFTGITFDDLNIHPHMVCMTNV